MVFLQKCFRNKQIFRKEATLYKYKSIFSYFSVRNKLLWGLALILLDRVLQDLNHQSLSAIFLKNKQCIFIKIHLEGTYYNLMVRNRGETSYGGSELTCTESAHILRRSADSAFLMGGADAAEKGRPRRDRRTRNRNSTCLRCSWRSSRRHSIPSLNSRCSPRRCTLLDGIERLSNQSINFM